MYYNPEKYGLTVVGTYEHSDQPYEFHTTCVWRDGNGKFYYGTDEGCSCPAPFENFTKSDLTELKDISVLANHLINEGGDAAEAVDFLYKVRKAMW
ncbi:MAG TPA: hypothetical protein VIY48_07240 [Candidatus Paceibacterota bacterium]